MVGRDFGRNHTGGKIGTGRADEMRHKHHVPKETGLHISTETDRLNLRKSELAVLHDDLQKILAEIKQIKDRIK